MWILACVFAHFFIIVTPQGNLNAQSDGIWSTINVDKCDEEIEDAVFTIDVEKHRINDSHEVFSCVIDATTDIDSTFGLHIVVCKHVDGGCKNYGDVIDNMEKTLNKFAKNNLERAFVLAGVDPPEFPIPRGHHVINNFLMDYCELPTNNSPYGVYEAQVHITKDATNVGCLKVIIEFAEDDGICS